MTLGEVLKMKLGATPTPKPEEWGTWRAQILMWDNNQRTFYGITVWEGSFKDSSYAKKAMRKAQKSLAPLWMWQEHKQYLCYGEIEYKAELFLL